MNDVLPWLLLSSTLTVRYLMAKHNRLGFYVDLLSVPGWLAYYALHGDWPLMAVPLVFAWLNVLALRRWWAR